jgi:hypothetical protein
LAEQRSRAGWSGDDHELAGLATIMSWLAEQRSRAGWSGNDHELAGLATIMSWLVWQ